MLSHRSFHFLRLTIPPLYRLGITRYNWDASSRQFFKSPERNLLVYFNVANLYVALIFNFCQAIRFYFSKDFHSLNFLFPFAAVLLDLCIMNAMVIFDADGLHEVLNMSLLFLQTIRSNTIFLKKLLFKLYIIN